MYTALNIKQKEKYKDNDIVKFCTTPKFTKDFQINTQMVQLYLCHRFMIIILLLLIIIVITNDDYNN